MRMSALIPQGDEPIRDSDHLLPAHKKSSGPLVGTVIIVVLLLIGALYFWGAALNRKNTVDQLPLIQGDVLPPTGTQ